MFEILTSKPWILWAVFCLVSLIAEMVLPYFACLFVSFAAGLAALAAVFYFNHWFQTLVFVLSLLLGLLFIRPKLIHQALNAQGVPERTSELIGKTGFVTFAATHPGDIGRITVEGNDWAAKSDALFQTGDQVKIEGSDGIILIVCKI